MISSSEYTNNYSRFLIKLAWTVEIIAVLIGLTISVVVAVSAYEAAARAGNSGYLSGASAILVATLPFVLIAVVELCKIPLTFAFTRAEHAVWRFLFLFFVFFLCLITFETMFNGFERNFSNLNRVIDIRKNEILNVDSQIALLEKRRGHIVKFTEEQLKAEEEAARAQADAEYKKQVANVDQKTRQMLAGIDYSFKDELDIEIGKLIEARDEYYADWAKENTQIESRFSKLLLGNISGSSEERQRLLADLEKLKAEFDDAMAKSNFFTKPTIEAKYRALIKEKEDQLATITTGYLGADAIEKQSTMEDQLKQQLAFVKTKYEGRIKDINARIEAKKQEVVDRTEQNAQLKSNLVSKAAVDKSRFAKIRSEQQQLVDADMDAKAKELEVISERSFGIDEKIFELKNQQRNLRSEINQLINQNQVYRLAMYAFNRESGAEVKRGEVAAVAIIWFGSLSLIASVCGVMLALAGFYLRRLGLKAYHEEREHGQASSAL